MRRHDFVFLDAQGTLLQARPSLSGVYSLICGRFGLEISETDLTAAVAGIWAEYRTSIDPENAILDTSDEITRQWWANFNGRLYERLGIARDRQAFLDALWDVFGRAENWTLFSDVEGALAELRRRGYKLAIVSNWDSRLLEICDMLGLSELMEFVVASAAVGVEKPDKRIFKIALAKAGIDAERAIHVGDDYTADVLGAKYAGVEAVYLDREGLHPENGHVPTIRSLSELPGLLD